MSSYLEEDLRHRAGISGVCICCGVDFDSYRNAEKVYFNQAHQKRAWRHDVLAEPYIKIRKRVVMSARKAEREADKEGSAEVDERNATA